MTYTEAYEPKCFGVDNPLRVFGDDVMCLTKGRSCETA